MNNYNVYQPQPQAEKVLQMAEEKRKIKKSANLIGAVFIILWLLPQVVGGILGDTAKLLGKTVEFGRLFSDPAFNMVLQTVLSILFFTLPFLIIPLGLGKSINELAAIKKPKKELFAPLVLVGVGISGFANIITNNIAAYFDSFGIHITAPDLNYPEGVFGFALSFIAVAVVPGLVEEFATRGMVMGAAQEFGKDYALITSAVFFALMHGNLVQIPFAFIMGIILGFAVIKTGSLVTGMAIHFLNNAISITMSYMMENIGSIIIQNLIFLVYIGICSVLLFVGIYLSQKREESIWSFEKCETALGLADKLKYFFFAPTMIIAMALTVLDCISTITLG